MEAIESFVKTKNLPEVNSHVENLTIDGVVYELKYNEWLTWNNLKASGYSCQVDKNTNLSAKSRVEIIKRIINHKPLKFDASSWYGNGFNNGD